MNCCKRVLTVLGFVLPAMLCMPAFAQVTRESATKSIAGVLDAYNPDDNFGFFSQGGEILFADVDSEIFQVKGRMGGTHEEDTTHTDEGGPPADVGPGEHEDHEEGDGCEDDAGGPGGLCLQVFNRAGEMLCWADRPMRPGWQRDPALACPLPRLRGNTAYILRVSLKSGGCGPGGHGGHEAATSTVPLDAAATPYLLNYSLRGIASDGHLETETAKSGF